MTTYSSKIEVIPYDPSLPSRFKNEATHIQKVLGNNCLTIHHIGSTSVVGLAGKPIIDMIPVVENILAVDNCNKAMANLGYEAKGEFSIPFRRFFKKPGFHLHVFEQANPEIDRHLRFRNWLINHPKDKEAYQALKENLANQYPHDIFNYCLGKEDLVSKIDTLAGFNDFRLVFALTHQQWQAVKKFRNQYFFTPQNIEDPYTWSFDQKDHKHMVIYKGQGIVGYAHLQLWPENRATIRIMVIDEKERRKNYGKELLRLIEKWLTLHNYKTIHTQSSKKAYGFYQRLGYQKMPFDDPDGYTNSPEDIAMGKMLSTPL